MEISTTLTIWHLFSATIIIAGGIVGFWHVTKTRILLLERDVAELKQEGHENNKLLREIMATLQDIQLQLKDKADRPVFKDNH